MGWGENQTQEFRRDSPPAALGMSGEDASTTADDNAREEERTTARGPEEQEEESSAVPSTLKRKRGGDGTTADDDGSAAPSETTRAPAAVEQGDEASDAAPSAATSSGATAATAQPVTTTANAAERPSKEIVYVQACMCWQKPRKAFAMFILDHELSRFLKQPQNPLGATERALHPAQQKVLRVQFWISFVRTFQSDEFGEMKKRWQQQTDEVRAHFVKLAAAEAEPEEDPDRFPLSSDDDPYGSSLCKCGAWTANVVANRKQLKLRTWSANWKMWLHSRAGSWHCRMMKMWMVSSVLSHY